MSGKDNHLVGQPFSKQLVNFIPKYKFDLLVQKQGSDRYNKSFIESILPIELVT